MAPSKPASNPTPWVLAAILSIAMVPQSAAAQGNSWTSLGPAGGSVHSVSIDPRNSEQVFIGTSGGYYRSENGGKSWTRFTVPDAPYSDLVFHPHDPSVIYARPRLHWGGRLYRSTDAGATWAMIEPSKKGVLKVAIHFQDPNTLFVLVPGDGVLKSTDGGQTWRPVNNGLTPSSLQTLFVSPHDPHTLFAGARDGLFKTQNGGESWKRVKEDNSYAITADPVEPLTMYVAGWAGPIFKSMDGGETWAQLSDGLQTPIAQITVDFSNRQTLYAGSGRSSAVPGKLFKSKDGGTTWVDTGLKDVQFHVMDPARPSTLYAGTNTDGVFKTTDHGVHWESVNSGMSAVNVRILAVDPRNSNIVYTAMEWGKIHKSADAGVNWNLLSGLPEDYYVMAFDPQNPRTLYAAGNTGVHKSNDGGETWSSLGLAQISALAVDPQNPAILYAGTSGGYSIGPESKVFKSVDGGLTWNDPTTTFTEYERGTGIRICSPGVLDLSVDSRDSNKVYAAFDLCADQGMPIARSADGGVNWTRTWEHGAGFGFVVKADPQVAGTVYAAGFGVQKSTNAGASFTLLSAKGWGSAFAIDPRDSRTLYAGGNNGVEKSSDAGATWVPLNEGLNAVVGSLAVSSRSPRTVYAGTTSGLFRIVDTTPRLSMNSSQYCVGDAWRLNVSDAGPGAAIRLLGTSNSQSWELADWRLTDPEGNLAETGAFAAGSEGSHTLQLRVDGEALSNKVAFSVSRCGP